VCKCVCVYTVENKCKGVYIYARIHTHSHLHLAYTYTRFTSPLRLKPTHTRQSRGGWACKKPEYSLIRIRPTRCVCVCACVYACVGWRVNFYVLACSCMHFICVRAHAHSNTYIYIYSDTTTTQDKANIRARRADFCYALVYAKFIEPLLRVYATLCTLKHRRAHNEQRRTRYGGV
jgi:hypothetical protein